MTTGRFFRSSGTCKIVLLALTLLFARAIAARAETSIEQGPIEFAVLACSDLSSNKDLILSELAQKGWLQINGAELVPERLVVAIASYFFAARHSETNADQLFAALQEAYFSATSILGNSALPPDQPSFTYGEVSLGVLGLSLEPPSQPYCIMSGPRELNGVVGNFVELEFAWPEHTYQYEFGRDMPYFLGIIGDAEIRLRVFDPEKLTNIIAHLDRNSLQSNSNQIYATELLSWLDPVSIMIRPSGFNEGGN